jgi:signal peptidase I
MKKYKKLHIVSFLRIDRVVKNRGLLEWIDAILFALIVVSFFRTWFYSPYRVPTGSMVHTIEKGDFLFANMHAYGYIIPFTKKKIFSKPIQRQDIAIFPFPQDPSINFIKRVIGIPGDRLEIKNEIVYINGEELDEPYKFLDNTLPTGRNLIIDIPVGKYFVMGDNRRNSQDSRYWGYVDEDTIRGKGWFVFWSHSPEKNLFSGYNFYRIGQVLR